MWEKETPGGHSLGGMWAAKCSWALPPGTPLCSHGWISKKGHLLIQSTRKKEKSFWNITTALSITKAFSPG